MCTGTYYFGNKFFLTLVIFYSNLGFNWLANIAAGEETNWSEYAPRRGSGWFEGNTRQTETLLQNGAGFSTGT